jgi:hypothetical protein
MTCRPKLNRQRANFPYKLDLFPNMIVHSAETSSGSFG